MFDRREVAGDNRLAEPTFARDTVTWLGIALWVVTLLPSLVPVLPPDVTFVYTDRYSDVGMSMASATVAILAMNRAKSVRERQFFGLLVVAGITWMAIRAVYLVKPPEHWGWGENLVADLLYLLGYLAIALALERRPDRGATPDRRAERRNVEAAGALVFAFGTLAYFVVIPSVFDPEIYASWVPSLFLYAVLDLALLVRLGTILRTSSDPEWRRPLVLLAVFTGLWLIGDVTEGLIYMEVLPWVDPGTPADVLWHAPSLAFFLAIRSRSWRGRDVRP